MRTVFHAGIYPHPPILILEVGGAESAKVAVTAEAMSEMAGRVKNSGAETMVLITPHGPVFYDAVALSAVNILEGSLAHFGAPGVRIAYQNDKQLLSAIELEADKAGIRTIMLDERGAAAYGVSAGLDHGALVPLYFLAKKGVRLPLVHITVGSLAPQQLFAFGQAVQRALLRLKRRAAIVVSGDLSHRLTKDAPAGFSATGQEFDQKIIRLLERFDPQSILSIDERLLAEAGECGYRPIVICLGILDGQSVQPEIISYEAPFGVGYLVADITPKDVEKIKGRAAESELVQLARNTLETFVRHNKIIKPDTGSSLLAQQAGAFVSLKINGQLRGCIGTIAPVQDNLAREIVENTISAGFYDPRFPPVSVEELPLIEYSVDVLSPSEPVSGPGELDPKKYGVIVQKGGRKGLLLPDLAGVDTVEKQLSIALEKAGIMPEEKYRISRFLVTRYY
ncbi:MAG: hypothetical protein DDT19_00720 [Syntrophomonadaceae bacterium]|nr:hypothetical protein [Bacillota bacterium]